MIKQVTYNEARKNFLNSCSILRELKQSCYSYNDDVTERDCWVDSSLEAIDYYKKLATIDNSMFAVDNSKKIIPFIKTIYPEFKKLKIKEIRLLSKKVNRLLPIIENYKDYIKN